MKANKYEFICGMQKVLKSSVKLILVAFCYEIIIFRVGGTAFDEANVQKEFCTKSQNNENNLMQCENQYFMRCYHFNGGG